MSMRVLLVFFVLTGLGLIISFTSTSGGRMLLDEDHQHHAPKVPEVLDLAGENVPLEYFWVMESLDRELLVNTYWHSNTFQHIKRSGRYFPLIETILKEEGIPDDFKYLAVAESGLLQAVSPSGARGIWQFMPATAKEYGLTVNDDVDERYHIALSTRAACRYLKAAYDTLGSWTMAAAAYNAGVNGMFKALKAQGTDNYYHLNLNTETARYVFRILAIKLILAQPDQFGYAVAEHEKYPPLKASVVKIDTAVTDIAILAGNLGVSYRALKELNPWMRSTKLPAPRKGSYKVLVPEDGGRWYR
jgi:hypothetical protein